MRSDIDGLWDFETWASPSPEEVVRARVLGRARTITRRRLAPVVAAVLLASAAALQGMTQTETSSKVHVTDTPPPAESPTAPPTEAVGRSSIVTTVEARQTRSPRGDHPPSASGDGDPTEPAASSAEAPLITDPAGDADGRIVCSSDSCTSNAQESQPAVDLLSGDLSSDGVSLSATIRVLDLSATTSVSAATGTHVGYGLCFTAEDAQSCVWGLVDRVNQTVSATGSLHRGAGPAHRVNGVVASVDWEHDTVTVAVPLAELNAALTGASSTIRFAEGTLLSSLSLRGAFVTKAADGNDVSRSLDTASASAYRIGD